MSPKSLNKTRVWLASTGVDPEMGGIASVARSCLKALSEDHPPPSGSRSIAVEKLICLNGSSEAPSEPEFPMRVSCRGRRFAFFARMLEQVTGTADLLIFDHLDLAQCQALVPSPLRRPYVVWAHGIDIWQPLPLLKRRGLLGAESLFFNSKFTLRQALQRHPWLEKVNTTIVPLCFEPGPTKDEGQGLEPRKPHILTVGRLEASRPKGHREILEVLPDLIEKVPDLEWHVAGNGPWFSELKRLVDRSKARQHIFMHGFVDDEKLNALYRTSRIFCMPSRGEGFGLVYAEAMRHGCACIGSTADAAPEVIRDAGVCVDPDDCKALSDALLNYLAMPVSDFENLSEKARARAELFSPPRFRENLVRALQSVIEPGRS